MAGVIKVDRVQSDSNLAFNIAGANVAFMDASALRMVGSNVVVGGTNVITSGKVTTSALPTGSMFQIAQTTKTDTFSTSSQSFVDITGLSVSITPTSASNKILVNFNVYVSNYQHVDLKLVRTIGATTTDTLIGDASGSRTRSLFHSYRHTNFNTTYDGAMVSFSFLDSPTTTSAITYKLQGACPYTTGQYILINRQYSEADAGYSAICASNIIAMEVAG